MSILNNFRNPWEADNWVLQTDVLDTSVLEKSVLGNNVLSLNKALTSTKGFRHGKSLVDKVYNKAVEVLKPLEDELKVLVTRNNEVNAELKTLSESEADLLRKEELMDELELIRTQVREKTDKIKNSEFTKARREIDKMREANAVFDVLPTQSHLGEAKFDGYSNEGLPIIGLYYPSENILDKVPLIAHELKHGYQFINGELAFDIKSGKATMLYDIVDEIEAFQRQVAFSGGKMTIRNKIGRMVDFYADERPTAVDIASLLDSYKLIFEAYGDNKISLNTKFSEVTEEGQNNILQHDIDYEKEYKDSGKTLHECLKKYINVIFYEK